MIHVKWHSLDKLEPNNESSCFNVVVLFEVSDFQVQRSLGLEWPSAEFCSQSCRYWIWYSKGAEKKAFCCPSQCRIAVSFCNSHFLSLLFHQLLGKFCLDLYCLTLLHELILALVPLVRVQQRCRLFLRTSLSVSQKGYEFREAGHDILPPTPSGSTG